MDIVDRIKELAFARNMTLKEVGLELGLGENSIYRWSKSLPKIENLEKVADFFHVSTDYLLGRTNNRLEGLSEEQRNLSIEEALKSVMSKDGKPIADEDIPVLKRIVEAYLEGK